MERLEPLHVVIVDRPHRAMAPPRSVQRPARSAGRPTAQERICGSGDDAGRPTTSSKVRESMTISRVPHAPHTRLAGCSFQPHPVRSLGSFALQERRSNSSTLRWGWR